MQYHQREVDPVEKVGEVEDLKVTATPDLWHRADDHDGQSENHDDASDVGPSREEAKEA